MNEFTVNSSGFLSPECILKTQLTKPGVVPLHSIVRYLHARLHVFSRTCNMHTDIEKFNCKLELKGRVSLAYSSYKTLTVGMWHATVMTVCRGKS